jgi:hypothetical protein
MNCGLRHFGNNLMQLFHRHASICAKFSFNFLKKFVRDQRWPTAPLFVVNISPFLGEFTAPLRHSLPIDNVITYSSNLFVNFRWTFTLSVEKSYDGMHLAFSWTLDRPCHFKIRLAQTKPVLPLSNEHGSRVKDQGRRQCYINRHKKCPYRPTRDVPLLSGHASYNMLTCSE